MGEPEHTDVVTGLGPGGEYAAVALAETGPHVTGIEARLVGGECPYSGCAPSEMTIRAGNAVAGTRRVPGMAGLAGAAAS
jgi:pyruvate/2-oxoglutarate dehydrogenase complex dihydrolipoamide dehydrogenase (E3) component